MPPSERSAESILAQARAFMESRIILTAAELDLFTRLAAAPLTAAEVVVQVGTEPRATTMLLDALAAQGLLTKQAERYTCPATIANYLASSGAESVLAMLRHQAALWPSWSELTDIVRGTGPTRVSRAVVPGSESDAELRAFIGAMQVVGRPKAERLANVIAPGAAQRLLDVGGGSGIFTLALLREAPQMKATLFDHAPVCELARGWLAAAGVLDRVTLAPGDFYVDELPGGHDLALLSAIIHQNSPKQNVVLYQKVWRALAPGGRLVIRDHVMSPDRVSPPDGALFAVNMLVRTAGGNSYTFDEIAADLTAAHFERVRLIQAPAGMEGLVEAFRPGP